MISKTQFNSMIQLIARVYDSELPRHEADMENLRLEVLLSFGNAEGHLFEYYSQLSNEGLMALSPNVHIWFLRRIGSLKSSLEAPTDVLMRVFLHVPNPLCRYLTTSLLVEDRSLTPYQKGLNRTRIEERSTEKPTSPIVELWKRVESSEHLPVQEKSLLLKELSRLLLDLQSQESDLALRELHSAQLQSEPREVTTVEEERTYRSRHTFEENERDEEWDG